MPLTADRNTPFKDTDIVAVPVAANAVIHAGAIVVANATGFAAPGIAAKSLIYLGRAEEAKDNTGGADGALTIRVRTGKAFQWENSGTDPVTQASLGKLCYIEDDQTVSATSSNAARSAAGIVIGLDSNGVWVKSGEPEQLSATATLDFLSIAAAASADLTIAVPGAAVGDAVAVGLPAAPAAGLVFYGFVSATDVVTVRAMNITAAAVDAPAGTFRASVFK